MNYADIKRYDVANGPGVRVSVFVSGCTHRCPGCFNEEAWDFNFGKPFTQETIDYIIDLLKPDFYKGITFLGGEPLEHVNQQGLLPLLQRIKKELPDKNIWVYSGYLYEDFLPGGRAYCEASEPFLSMIDVMVDGPFILGQKDIGLNFRGSSNQRIINVPETRKKQEIILLME